MSWVWVLGFVVQDIANSCNNLGFPKPTCFVIKCQVSWGCWWEWLVLRGDTVLRGHRAGVCLAGVSCLFPLPVQQSSLLGSEVLVEQHRAFYLVTFIFQMAGHFMERWDGLTRIDRCTPRLERTSPHHLSSDTKSFQRQSLAGHQDKWCSLKSPSQPWPDLPFPSYWPVASGWDVCVWGGGVPHLLPVEIAEIPFMFLALSQFRAKLQLSRWERRALLSLIIVSETQIANICSSMANIHSRLMASLWGQGEGRISKL